VHYIHLAQSRDQWPSSSEHGNEISGSIIGGEFLELFSDYKLIKKDSAPWS
jgi:hypothetical protein